MPVNLINEKALNKYLSDIVFKGNEAPDINKKILNSKASDIEANKDIIAKSMVFQWTKKHLRNHLTENNDKEFLNPVKMKNGLPVWAENVLNEGKEVYEFDKTKIPENTNKELCEISEFLYSRASAYLDKEINKATQNGEDKEVSLKLDYLKANNELNSYEKALHASKKWNELLSRKAKNITKDPHLKEKSERGTEFEMELSNGMKIVKLNTPEALKFESEVIKIYFGKSLEKEVKNGSTQIYSLRDKSNNSHATIEVSKDALLQCKGKNDKMPKIEYIPAIVEFASKKDFEIYTEDAGLFKYNDGKVYSLFDLPRDKEFVLDKVNLFNLDLKELPDLSNAIVLGDFNCGCNDLTQLNGLPKEVRGNFNCASNKITSLESNLKIVKGNFDASFNLLNDVKGAPEIISGDFNCSQNNIKTLENGPKEVWGSYYCEKNELTSLKGMPQTINGNFNCSKNKIASLEEGVKEVKGYYNCDENELTSLKGVAEIIPDAFSCSKNKITSLENGPKEVRGSYYCDENELTSLKGVTEIIGDSFSCSKNQLQTLEHGPKEVKGHYDCYLNQLTSLKGAPETIHGDFDCSRNQLKDIKHSPKNINGSFIANDNQIKTLENGPEFIKENISLYANKLTSLKGLQKEVHGSLDLYKNQLTSFEGGPEIVKGNLSCSQNNIDSLKYSPNFIGKTFDCSNNPIKSHKYKPKHIGGSYFHDIKKTNYLADIYKKVTSARRR